MLCFELRVLGKVPVNKKNVSFNWLLIFLEMTMLLDYYFSVYFPFNYANSDRIYNLHNHDAITL